MRLPRGRWARWAGCCAASLVFVSPDPSAAQEDRHRGHGEGRRGSIHGTLVDQQTRLEEVGEVEHGLFAWQRLAYPSSLDESLLGLGLVPPSHLVRGLGLSFYGAAHQTSFGVRGQFAGTWFDKADVDLSLGELWLDVRYRALASWRAQGYLVGGIGVGAMGVSGNPRLAALFPGADLSGDSSSVKRESLLLLVGTGARVRLFDPSRQIYAAGASVGIDLGWTFWASPSEWHVGDSEVSGPDFALGGPELRLTIAYTTTTTTRRYSPVVGRECGGLLCDLRCDSGWGNCNGRIDDGCETKLDSATHCGGCERECEQVRCGASR